MSHQSHHFLTLSIALITRLISSFALLRVSARTALDILNKINFFYQVTEPLISKNIKIK